MELSSDIWKHLDLYYSQGTQELMLSGSSLSTSHYSKNSQIFDNTANLAAGYIPPGQLPHSPTTHYPIDPTWHCHSPDSISIGDCEGNQNDDDENDDGEGDNGESDCDMDNRDNDDYGEDDSSLETASMTGILVTEASDNNNESQNDGGIGAGGDGDDNDEILSVEGPLHVCTFPGCGKLFKRRTNMNTHRKKHDGVIYPCEVESCSEVYMQSGDRKRHMDRFHYGMRWRCHGCEQRLTRKPNLKKRRESCPGTGGYHVFEKTVNNVGQAPVAG
jgi:hypothetical protein